MDTALAGGLVNLVRCLMMASPTILIGLFIAALMRYYLGPEHTRRLFGGDSIRSLPQSWLLGMLMPVCSIGVIPIICEMHRVKIRPGAITAFALSAPLFNPLSLLYGLTLSRPYVILGFALASLLVVTLIGLVWDRLVQESEAATAMKNANFVGLLRLKASLVFVSRELRGTTAWYALLAVMGVGLLGMILPHGALQTSAEQDDPLAPLRMALIAVPVYATPMQTISQLGMMFAHGNSPGAAFCLLLLGTGVNLGTLWWLKTTYGLKPSAVWFCGLLLIVVGCAYAVDKPLIPPGVEPAGHTHAFDVYSNPFGGKPTLSAIQKSLADSVGIAEFASFIVICVIALAGAVVREPVEQPSDSPAQRSGKGWDRDVSPGVVGATGLIGLVALSIVGCYAYYPSAEETLEEMRLARTETLSSATSGHVEEALRWLEVWEEWSRRLEVGTYIRQFQLRPYQQMQAYILRKKLELLEHELEHEELDKAEIAQLNLELSQTSQRLAKAFRN